MESSFCFFEKNFSTLFILYIIFSITKLLIIYNRHRKKIYA